MDTITNPQPQTLSEKKHKKILLIVAVCVVLIISFFILRRNTASGDYSSIQIPKTIGAEGGKLTLSPDNRWLLYFERKYPYDDQYNLIGYDTSLDKKFVIDTTDVNSYYLHTYLEKNCWSKDSKYCIVSFSSSTSNATPDVIIDFSNPDAPVVKKQYIDDPKLINPPKIKTISVKELSPEGFSCSDCGNKIETEKHLDGRHTADEFYSPDRRFIAQIVTTYLGSPGDIVLGDKLYVIDTTKNTRYPVISNVYDEVRFTSDSKGMYYYRCKNGGGCNGETDGFFYTPLVDNIKPNGFSSPAFNQFSITKHSDEEEMRDSEVLQKKEEEEKRKVLKVHYDTYVNDFKNPVKIVAANFDRFYTNNNRMIRLIADTSMLHMTGEEYKDVYKSLIGKTVTVVMPSFEEFVKTYQDETVDGVFPMNYSLWGFKADGSEGINIKPAPSDPVYHKYFGLIYANVYLDGKRVNDLVK